MSIIIIVCGSVLEKDDWFLVEHFGVGFVTFHIFEECDMIFNLALCFCNVVGLAHVWQLVQFTMVVLESYLVLLHRIYGMRIIWGRSCSVVPFLSFGNSSLALIYLNLKW